MKIISTSVTLEDLRKMAQAGFGDMVKAVAVDAELHAELETLLLQEGSPQGDLWGVDLSIRTRVRQNSSNMIH